MTNDFKPAKAGGNQPRLSKEEYAEKKRAEKEKVYQMIDDAAREIVSDPEKFKNFLIRRVEWTDIPQQMLSLFTVSIRRRHSLKILMIGVRTM